MDLNWPDVTVTDDSLTKAISEIRKALGQDGHTLQTAAKRGYSLTGWTTSSEDELSSPGRTSSEKHKSLPWAPPLIGRDEDLGRLNAYVRQKRLVTLTGTGGVGKTSLALACGRQSIEHFRDGVFFVDLSACINPDAVVAAIGATTGLAGEFGGPSSIARLLSPLHALVILDNCEHLLNVVAEITAVAIERGPDVHLLLTSRERLGLDNEQVVEVRPLALPTSDCSAPLEALQTPSMTLLLTRVAQSVDGFVPTEADFQASMEICRRVDGIPLAIVLAAARASAMSLPEIAVALRDNFELLYSSRGYDRQKTVRAMVAWSVGLLSAQERDLFEQIGVFSGRITASDIAEVCEIGGRAPGVDLIVSLADKSLLNVHRERGSTRYSYFETTRHYALERLAVRGNRKVRLRHVAFLAAKFKRAEAEVETTPTSAWQDAYSPYIDNIRSALGWCFSPGGDYSLGSELLAHASELFEALSLQQERLKWIRLALREGQEELRPEVLGRLLLWQALGTGWGLGNRELLERAAGQFAKSGERYWQGRALSMAMVSNAEAGNWDSAWKQDAMARHLLLPAGNTRAVSDYLRYRGKVLSKAGRLNDAEGSMRQSARVAEAVGDTFGTIWARSGLADIALLRGKLASAVETEEKAMEMATAIASPLDLLYSNIFLSGCRFLQEDNDRASQNLMSAFELTRRIDMTEMTPVLIGLVALWLDAQKDTRTTTFACFALKRLDSSREGLLPIESAIQQQLRRLVAMPEHTGPDMAAAMWSDEEALEAARKAFASA